MNYKRCIDTVEKTYKNKKVHMLRDSGKTYISDGHVIYRIDEPFSYPEERYLENKVVKSLLERGEIDATEAIIGNVVLDLDAKPKIKARLVYTEGRYGFINEKYLKPLSKAELRYFLNKDNHLIALDEQGEIAALIAALRLSPGYLQDFENVMCLMREG